ncbi:hypothetical protein ILYODFUR_001967 [Ilyodon furcidens]|uniref:Uncharacterized protein n=1 Tax=Ilyodon furcidens TaxID=33524 RepID=A0ABV0UDX6_9TELE
MEISIFWRTQQGCSTRTNLRAGRLEISLGLHTRMHKRLNMSVNSPMWDPASVLNTPSRSSQLAYLFSTALSVCFFNLCVYTPRSKPVSVAPNGAIITKGKKFILLMKASPRS